jgi:hypothetical protein
MPKLCIKYTHFLIRRPDQVLEGQMTKTAKMFNDQIYHTVSTAVV